MDINEVMKRMNKLEYHQKLLLKVIENRNLEFFKLIVEKSLTEREVKDFFRLCEELSMELEEQKAEGFVYFHPLYNKFKYGLHKNLEPKEVVQACLAQGLFSSLMSEFVKYP
ncbi:DUF1878 family protein [Bacillus sp. DTU_2020_1000418_1_SI_GHA_SEK_038]|uniref:DUF1878 family protein n=1 Tax=Bacillus sp. DTU_2020_1000418_1_SI_GHA_SEK_038 TaxID=3077585 RepID=UPI0028E24A3A|nr:DUF1878 family protein [Bacillus sp. DTU_2020_1000418_1_SI_GHA_SEK_038]WNS76765.1 DUF1878 family protein [Bacillus sp. DTU_2020_1000418_1_SI_GHA_SEK_038]